jgi:uncharacterized protein (DUF1800 family)
MLADIARPNAGRMADHNLLRSDAAWRAHFADRQERKQARTEGARRERKESMAAITPKTMSQGASDAMATKPSTMQSSDELNRRRVQSLHTQIYLEEGQARSAMALVAEIGIAERLVWFWSNHFCASAKKRVLRSVVGAFEREAIRPYVLGRFSDMLLAVESHPAMLTYLDNVRSVGPNSRAGQNRGRGLNENLAREILELHTLGVRSVYTQADVTTFAKVLTGWSTVSPRGVDERGGQFTFNARRHEPGPQTLLGKTYPDNGVEQGRSVLNDIARHPATARHIAAKLVTHFVSDTPPQTLVERISKRFLDTDGDLKEVTKALLESDEAWTAPRAKLKRPSEWIISAMRATGAKEDQAKVVRAAQDALGEPLWQAPSPRGFPDQSSEWIDGIAERLDVAAHLSRLLAAPDNPEVLIDNSLGPLCSEKTKSTIMRAGDRAQALALLFMAPEFQLR